MKLLLFFEEKCTPGRKSLLRLAGFDFTALVARVLSIFPRKFQNSQVFDVARPREKSHNHAQNVHFAVCIEKRSFYETGCCFVKRNLPLEESI